jgi:hypothetical protein
VKNQRSKSRTSSQNGDPAGWKSQAQAHQFLLRHLENGTTFTRDEFRNATGWPPRTFRTYWSKRFTQVVERVGVGKYRVAGAFEKFRGVSAFRRYMSQATRERGVYALTKFPTVVTYEFYLPLAHEAALRRKLDALFYEDSVMPRLRRMNQDQLEALLPSQMLLDDLPTIERAREFVNRRFSGYSIYHVNGRFRADDLKTQTDAAESSSKGEPYLIDETTAVVRFIFPCGSESEADTTRLLFNELFVQPIIDVISGEDQIWMIEGGTGSRAHVWKNENS